MKSFLLFMLFSLILFFLTGLPVLGNDNVATFSSGLKNKRLYLELIDGLNVQERITLSNLKGLTGFLGLVNPLSVEDLKKINVKLLQRPESVAFNKDRIKLLRKITQFANSKGLESVDLETLAETSSTVLRGDLDLNSSVISTQWICTRRGLGGIGRTTCELIDLPTEALALIEAAFQNQAPLTIAEYKRGKKFGLTVGEIKELKAVRIATKVFELYTYLKNDVGSWIGNLNPFYYTIEDAPGSYTRCAEESKTYIEFLRRLRWKKFLKSFDGIEFVYRLNHRAVGFKLKRTGKSFVLDSWHEDGGKAAHIVTLEDWEAGNDYNDVVILPMVN